MVVAIININGNNVKVENVNKTTREKLWEEAFENKNYPNNLHTYWVFSEENTTLEFHTVD